MWKFPLTRRNFCKGITGAAASAFIRGLFKSSRSYASTESSVIFKVKDCPVHDNKLRHIGVDRLLDLMADDALHLFRTGRSHQWGSLTGIIDKNDVVLIKVNSQWKCRGATNTDVVRGLIHRILQHPDGFSGEIVIFENGQKQGSFDGDPIAWGRYKDIPEIAGVHVNAEDDTLTVDRLVNEEFVNSPVSSFLLDPVSDVFITEDDHETNGYRIIEEEQISYPCFTTQGGHRIELKEGLWNGTGYSNAVKLINIPVLKTHSGTGITGVLKNSYGILSMRDNKNWNSMRHYEKAGSQCGKMYSIVRMPDLNIVDAIWVTYDGHHRGYPPSTTHRANTLMAGLDPVALDYYGSKYMLHPLGGERAREHDPDSFPGLINHITGAQTFINTHGGINGIYAQQGDNNIMVIERPA